MASQPKLRRHLNRAYRVGISKSVYVSVIKKSLKRRKRMRWEASCQWAHRKWGGRECDWGERPISIVPSACSGRCWAMTPSIKSGGVKAMAISWAREGPKSQENREVLREKRAPSNENRHESGHAALATRAAYKIFAPKWNIENIEMSSMRAAQQRCNAQR